MQTQSILQRRLCLTLALFLMLLPAAVFYLILWKNAVRIPILDDYHIVLAGANVLSSSHGCFPKLLYVLTAQHNGYKLMFENAVVVVQYSLFGQVAFPPLVALGNSFALLIFLTVYSMFRGAPGDLPRRCLLFVPVAYLMFQLQYSSALDFASSSLQHLSVICFSFLTISLLGRNSRWLFAGACISFVLAVASSPNGFFVAPIGLLMLGHLKRFWRIPVWVGTVALMLALYLFRYGRTTSPEMMHGSAGILTHINILYALSFLGSAAAGYVSLAPSLALGLALCGVFSFAANRLYFQRNPAVFYSMLFILINALAISGLRSDLGLTQSLASRYRTYSNLFLVFSYMFLIEDLTSIFNRRSFRRGVVIGAGVLSVAFCALSDLAGASFLHGKKQALIQRYRIQWKKDLAANDAVVTGNPALLRQMNAGVFDVNVPVMEESVRLGVYQPPLELP